MNFNFDFSFFTVDFITTYLLDGFYFSVTATVVATVIGFLFGTALALARLSNLSVLTAIAGFYITVMRSIPLVLVILWFYLAIPSLIGQRIDWFWSALITFTAFEAAYFAEIMRSGILSVARGQGQASDALGMRYMQKMVIVVLPQAFRNMLPVLLTQVIILFQDTSLVYVITGHDLLKGFELGGSNYGRRPEAYILAALTYFIICFSLSQIIRLVQKKVAIIR